MNETEHPLAQYERLEKWRNQGRDNGFKHDPAHRLKQNNHGNFTEFSGTDIGAMLFGKFGNDCASQLRVVIVQADISEEDACALLLEITPEQLSIIEGAISTRGIFGALRLACGVAQRKSYDLKEATA